MQAARVHERGGPERLVVEDAAVPPAGIGDVLVRVHAASFTPTELTWTATWTDRLGRDRLPIIPGHEVSGVVAELGYGTFGLAVGDEVYGLTDWYRDGTAAEYVAVEARNLAQKPASLDHTATAAIPMAALTATQALFDIGRLVAGQTVVIHGAGGGVGSFAVQLAHAAGARVIGTGHARSRELVEGLGANVFVDVGAERLEDAVSEADLVFDLVGGELVERSWSILRPRGRLVSAVESPTPPADLPDLHGAWFVVEARGRLLEKITRRIDTGELKPVVGQVVPLERIRDAFTAKAGGGVPGKVVLKVGGDSV